MFKLFLVTALLALAISRKTPQISDDPYPYAIQHSLINLGDPTWQIAQGEFSSGLIVYFYETYCLPCRQFWSELTTATNAIAQELPKGTNPPMAKVECHDEIRLCDAQGVTNFPTILFYQRGKKPQEYTGARTAAAFETWAKKVLIGEYHEVSTKEELFSRYSTAILLNDEFDYVDRAYDELIDTVEIAMAAGDLKSIIKGDGLILTQGGLNEKLPTSAEGIVSRIRKILYNEKEAVPTFGQMQSLELQGPEKIDYVLFFKTKLYKYDSSEAKAFDKSAQGQWRSSEFEFAYVNVDGDTLGGTMGKQFGVKSDDALTVGIASKNGKNIKKYRLAQNEAVTEDSINKLLKDFQESKESKENKENKENKEKTNVKELDQYMMSAPVPVQKLKSGDVVELVGSNFKEITGNSTMNVFVEFYFPWCEWCMKLEPTWKSLAYRYRDIKDLMFARIDVSQNDIEYPLTEFPVLFFYEAKPDAEPIEYLSDKTMRNLKTFVESHVSAAKETAIDL